METLAPLASALGLGMLAGARLYATVFAIGLLLRLNWVALPAAWQHASVLADTRVLVASGVACAIEFVADKIHWVDSAWDSLHTFIRPIGAALLASPLFANVDPAYKVLLFLLAGGMALSGHAAKTATRLAVNHSPEPFSNIALSLAEDAAVAGGLYMLVNHPWVMAGVALGFLLFFAWLAPRICRALRAEWTTFGALFRSWFGKTRKAQLGPHEQEWIAEHWSGRAAGHLLRVIASGELNGLRNRVGALYLARHEAVFFTRKWGRFVARQVGPAASVEIKSGLLVDQLVLVSADGRRTRFDLLAGQSESAREAVATIDQTTKRAPGIR